jgi:medium-chain acyl-[acyl-carrier-protein] hydrolase
MVSEIVDAIVSIADRPFAFFGHSMGGLLSFEVARTLRRAGAELPRRMFLSASRPPHIAHECEPLHLLPYPAFRAALARMGGTPAEILADDDFMAFISPIVRGDFAAIAGYRHEEDAPLPVDFDLLAARDDTEVPFDRLHEWKRHTTGAFSLETYSGGHFYLSRARDSVLKLVERKLLETAHTGPV